MPLDLGGQVQEAAAQGELGAVVAPPLARRTRTGLRCLAQKTFVDFPKGSAARRQREAVFAAAGLTTDVAFEGCCHVD
ncbi:hypothetical protein [Streptomyces sp. NPDC006510]|uniref:hypothetical protein n=1 Tax=Streptomyces sp. NPDC006510 TaxID=3155600 RepID=UPI0033AB1A7F